VDAMDESRNGGTLYQPGAEFPGGRVTAG
jgi:hypothetical protein